MNWSVEHYLDIETLDRSVLMVGGFWSGGLKSLQDAALELAQQGRRIQIFDGQFDWTTDQPGVGTQIQRIDKPYRRSPVLPAGQIQVWSAPKDEQDMKALWQALDPNTGEPGPDLFIFSQALPMLHYKWFKLDTWIGAWEERARILFYVDGQALYAPYQSLVRELILYPHEVTPEMQEALESGGIGIKDWNDLRPGHFVRLPDPINNVPTALPERHL